MVTGEGDARIGVRRVLVSPCKLASPIDLRVLLAADVLARRRRAHTARVEVAFALNHGGKWTSVGVRGIEELPDAVGRRREKLQADIAAAVERLGLDCGARVRFSLDPDFARGAERLFAVLFARGCITRDRVVAPWCFSCMTALDSDRRRRAREEAIEAVQVLFPLKGTDKKLPVLLRSLEFLGATVGVALHPGDKTLAPLIGRTVRVPLYGREAKVFGVTEQTLVGKVRPVLPAYDQTDFDLAQANHLAVVDVLGNDGRLNAAAGRYAGRTAAEARELIRQDLAEAGALGGTEAVTIARPECEICGQLLGARATYQWFVHLDALGGGFDRVWLRAHASPAAFRRALEAEAGRGKWCVSRQSEWGVPLPVWYCGSCGEFTVSLGAPESCAECGAAAFAQAPEKLSSGFLAAVWPLLAAAPGADEDEEPEPALTTVLFGEQEAELAYLTLRTARGIASTQEIERAAAVKPCAADVPPPEAERDALRVSLLMKGAPDEWYEQARCALRAFVDFFARVAALKAEPLPAGGDAPLLEQWLVNACRHGERLLRRALDDVRLGFLGEILYRFALSPVSGVYLPRLPARPPAAAAFAAAELAARVVPYLALLAPAAAEEIRRAGFREDSGPGGAVEDGPIDRALLGRVRQLLRLERLFDREPDRAARALIRGPATEAGALRRAAEAFGIATVSAALARPSLAGVPYRGEIFGEVVLLVPAEESNLDAVIERLRRRRAAARRDAAESNEFINELKRVGEGGRADDGA